ncbi:hypothetical protein F4553_000173 [Allocatelliglobosispora scoriae]|uniref:LamG-like jellyroll fold domain-containing protein n=1 Tax=Allocatelliglobosispora scoriae TaxID=643052 RepID=A0A841BES1_9ACTN|nr:LamG-like jellyroll fold domain-containing protein [Allocatelliglobosispora scoriae]MBB5866794.1 hypothetical protein [Allocatelliglobosispora scoriae]
MSNLLMARGYSAPRTISEPTELSDLEEIRKSTFGECVTVDHQGTVFAFVRASENGDILYNILDSQIGVDAGSDGWTGYSKLEFPPDLRPAGLSIVTVGNAAGDLLAASGAPFKVVSDGKYLHVFQQSSRHTLLLNRFMFKRVSEPGSGTLTPVLEPVWEVRFQQSGDRDVPLGEHDSQSYTTVDGTPFIEPVIELPMISDLDESRFDALILPGQDGSPGRWQFFAVNTRTGRLDFFSFPMDADGLFDLTDAIGDDGTIEPDVSVRFSLDDPTAGILPLTIVGAPSATEYTLRERVRTTSGEGLMLQRATRVMLALPVTGVPGTDQAPRFATLDCAIAKDGSLVLPPAETTVAAIAPANYALGFSDGAYVSLPDAEALRIAGSFATEFWLYPNSLVAGDQYVISGDRSVPATEAAVYIKITHDLRVAAGFGSGDTATETQTTDAVIVGAQWVHVVVRFTYDRDAAIGTFTVLVNGDVVPLTEATVHACPAGNPITTISGSRDGIVGILEGLRLWSGADTTEQPIADWPFNSVNYEAEPPTTPDVSGNRIDAVVDGAILTASSAPISADTQGRLYIDDEGRSVYAGLLDFAEPEGSGYLMTGSDGLVHLYFQGGRSSTAAGLFCVAQYDAESARAVYESGWTATAGSAAQNGFLRFTAARSGTFMNLAEITISPSSASHLCQLSIDDGNGRMETWLGVPRSLDSFIAVLNGLSTHDLADTAYLTGNRVFYDNAGIYATSRLPVASEGEQTRITVLSRYPSRLQLSRGGVTDVTAETCTLRLEFVVPGWGDAHPVKQEWTALPVRATALLAVLAGTSATYDYSDLASASSTVRALVASDAYGAPHDLLILARPDVTDMTIGIAQGTSPDLCDVSITAGPGNEALLRDVPRNQNGFADAVNASAIAAYLVLIADGATALLSDVAASTPAEQDMRAWAAITVGFPDRPLGTDATMIAREPVPAAVRQGSTLTTADGRTRVVEGASTMFRCSPANRPTNGGTAMVDDTTAYTDGSANLVIAAVNGGWVRQSPDKAITLDGGSAVGWDQSARSAQRLAVRGDLTVETWCSPGGAGSVDAIPRLATYCRDLTDTVHGPIQWALGLRPAPSLRFADNTSLPGSYNLPGTACTMQITLSPEEANGSGKVLSLSTIGATQPYVAITVDDDRRPVARYATGSLIVTGTARLAKGVWKQLTVTLAEAGAGQVKLRLYVDGVLDGEAVGAKAAFTQVPGSFRVGATTGAFPILANGVFLWTSALEPEDVAFHATSAPQPTDRDLVIAWYLTDGHGFVIHNAAIDGGRVGTGIVNPADEPWSRSGIYRAAWGTNRSLGVLATDTPLLGGWHNVAMTYRTAHALALGGADYADCGSDASLNIDTAGSIEVCFTPHLVDAVQSLVSKPGSYEIRLTRDNKVNLVLSTTSSEESTVSLTTPDSPVRRDVPLYVAVTVETGTTKEKPEAYRPGDDPRSQRYFLRAAIYVNGSPAKEYVKDDYEEPITIATSSQRLNLGRNTAGAAYFTGALSDVRLWNRALPQAEIAATSQSHRIGSADGLVSSWRWAQSKGKYGLDDNNVNNARLTSNVLWRIYPANSTLSLFVDGVRQSAVRVVDPELVGGYGIEQYTVAANRTGTTTLQNMFAGSVSEVRVWDAVRTEDQIRSDMYRALRGSERHLVGYWPFNEGSGMVVGDATGNGNDGVFTGEAGRLPRWITARAPISDEAKEVYNILGGLRNEHHEPITGVPSAVEYADTRRNAYGEVYSVMKRGYAAQVGARVDLVTGFLVGDLATVYAGQARTAPSLVGFVEGAPPIPSENQTAPWWDDVTSRNAYDGNAAIQVTQAQTATRTFTGGQRLGDASSADGKVGMYFSTSAGQAIGVGTEVEWQVAVAEQHLGAGLHDTASAGSGEDAGFGFGTSAATVDAMSTTGEWEDEHALLNPAVGRRYIPDNTGYAVVKSMTVDVYLAKLLGSNTIVKTTFVPNGDIPEDVNIIHFPIDPRYTKNGTLDGMVGFIPDPDYPAAGGKPASYFRPVEAYSLKRSVEWQGKQLEAYYRQFSQSNRSRGPAWDYADVDWSKQNGFVDFRDKALPAEPSYDWQKKLSKRGIVNTYVWTAAGGWHSEQSELIDTRSESYSGITVSERGSGLAMDIAAAIGAGLYCELDALNGSSVEVVSVKSHDSESGFGLDVQLAVERYLKRPLLDEQGKPVGYTRENAPGKVAGYRFLSILTPPTVQNFDTFRQQVIDQNWLHNSPDSGAAALRTATTQANGAWRVLHRVTYVNRVPAPLQPVPTETTATELVRPADLAGNIVVTQLVERQISVAPYTMPTPAQIGAAVTAVLGESPADPGLLAHALTWWTAFLTAAGDERSDAHHRLVELRGNLLGYMVQKYATEPELL